MKKILIFGCLILSTFACVNQPANKERELNIEVKEPARIRFSGKGAGAGMMLSSSMGPMGIAIGVAIDEGIAKQIDENAVAGGFSIEDVIARAFASSNRDVQITVKRYGFLLAKGDYPEDHVLPELELELRFSEVKVLHLRYPPAGQAPDVKSSWSLNTIKSDAEAVASAFEMAAAQLASELPRR